MMSDTELGRVFVYASVGYAVSAASNNLKRRTAAMVLALSKRPALTTLQTNISSNLSAAAAALLESSDAMAVDEL